MDARVASPGCVHTPHWSQTRAERSVSDGERNQIAHTAVKIRENTDSLSESSASRCAAPNERWRCAKHLLPEVRPLQQLARKRTASVRAVNNKRSVLGVSSVIRSPPCHPHAPHTCLCASPARACVQTLYFHACSMRVWNTRITRATRCAVGPFGGVMVLRTHRIVCERSPVRGHLHA